MKLKKISVMALACAVSLGFLGCGEDKTQEVYKVKFAHIISANTPKRAGC